MISIAHAQTYLKRIEYYTNPLTKKINGVLIDIFNIICEKAKLRPTYRSVTFKQGFDDTNIVNRVDKNFREPSLIVRKRNLKTLRFETIETMELIETPIMESEYKLIISPAESFSSYEKLILPFDKFTWFLLLLTFLFAFGSVLILNHARRSIQDLIYGADVKLAGFNIIQIFFGIGLNKLPEKWFPQLLLLLFITFCLIFRTAYQSVLFEFITTDMRKPLPTSFQQLIDQNYQFVFTLFDKTNEFEGSKLNQKMQKYRR